MPNIGSSSVWPIALNDTIACDCANKAELKSMKAKKVINLFIRFGKC